MNLFSEVDTRFSLALQRCVLVRRPLIKRVPDVPPGTRIDRIEIGIDHRRFQTNPANVKTRWKRFFLNPLSYYNNRVSRIRSARFSDQKTGGKLVKTKLQKNGECHQCPDEKYVSKTRTGGGGTWGTNGNTTDSVGSFSTVVPNRWSADHRWSVT